nr:MAG TPA_asm: hypothetical protein [Caudoviricetes sp.]DAZ55182.1 MAG TPA: hypothetical protein [Caudoviricetes sp.]
MVFSIWYMVLLLRLFRNNNCTKDYCLFFGNI